VNSGGSSWYKYNADGLRVEKTTLVGTTKFVWEDGRLVAQKNGTDELVFVYDINDEVTGFVYDGDFYGYHKNLQGDVTGIYDENQQTVVEYVYDTWGKVVSVTGSNTAIGNLNPIRYRGYYWDGETGWYYLQSRYYDPGVGRFVNGDVPEIMFFTGVKLLGTNLFAYTDNNPVKNIDPSGYATKEGTKTKTKFAPYYPWGLGGPCTWLACTIDFKYDSKTKKFKSVTNVESYLLGATNFTWIQTGKAVNFSKSKKTCYVTVNGYSTVLVGIKFGPPLGFKIPDTWKFTFKV